MDTQFDIVMPADDPKAEFRLVGDVWHLVHAIASRHALQFRVDFPKWADPVKSEEGVVLKAGRFGSTMRIIAAADALKRLFDEVSAHKLVQCEVIHATAPRAAGPAPETHFKRVRAHERAGAAYEARHNRRAHRRALEGRPIQPLKPAAERVAARASRRVNFVHLRSATNSQKYALSVERREGVAPGGFDSFGLSLAVNSLA